MILYAPAKVNLYLRVLDKRSDGYHNIETVFERIALCDKIVLRSLRGNRIKIFCDNPEVPVGKTTLIYKAVDLLKRKASLRKGVDIKIFKRIPIAAGLGGGSSDVASILTGLNKMWKVSLCLRELISLGKKLGADVPFFLSNISFAIAGERGDEVTPLLSWRQKFWHLVIYPPVKILSKDIYEIYSRLLRRRRCETTFRARQVRKVGFDHLPDLPGLEGGVKESPLLRNDLERVVIEKAPVVGRIKAALRRIGIKSSLVSGSGPSVFAIFKRRKEAMSARRRLIRHFSFVKDKGWQIFIVPTM